MRRIGPTNMGELELSAEECEERAAGVLFGTQEAHSGGKQAEGEVMS